MTTELEEQFFKTFGIEKNNNNCPMLDKNNCIFVPSECNYYQYPEIKDRMLLELIFRLIKYEETFEDSQFKNIKELKNYILAKCISIKTTGDKWLARQIQQLFKEGE